MTRVAEVIASALAHARVARVFAAEGADRTLADALRAAGLAVIPVRAAASACVMAAITGTLSDAPGAALIEAADEHVSRALAAALRDRASAIIIASRALSSTTMGKLAVDSTADRAASVNAPLDAAVDRAAPVKTTMDVTAETEAPVIARAMRTATHEPPGPVWLTIEPALLTQPSSAATPPPSPFVSPSSPPIHASSPLTPPSSLLTRGSSPAVDAEGDAPIAMDTRQVDAVADRLAACERPIIIAGRQCRAPGTAGWLRAFAESVPAPVLVTPAARGVLPDPHPLAFGLLRADAAVLARADLIVALGVDDMESAGLTQKKPMLRLGRGVRTAAHGVTAAEIGNASGTGADVRTARAAAAEAARTARDVGAKVSGTTHGVTETDAAQDIVAEGDVSALLEELAARLRGRVRADWDVAELDRLRRAIPVPAADPALGDLITRVRDATPAGTAIVFPRALEPLAVLWQAVGPGEVVVADDVMPAGIAVALARPENATLVLARQGDTPLAELEAAVATRARVIVLALDGRAIDDAAVRAAGARIARPLSLPALEAALGGALVAAPSVIVCPTAG